MVKLYLCFVFFSYFDHGKLGAWAGPKHWKFKPLSRLAALDATDSGGRNKKKKVSTDVIERLLIKSPKSLCTGINPRVIYW